MNENKFNQFINDYVAGTLPAEQRVLFENQLKIDADLREEVDLHKALVEKLEERYLRNKLREAAKRDLLSSTSTPTSGRVLFFNTYKKQLAMASTVLIVLLGASLYYFYAPEKKLGEEPFAGKPDDSVKNSVAIVEGDNPLKKGDNTRTYPSDGGKKDSTGKTAVTPQLPKEILIKGYYLKDKKLKDSTFIWNNMTLKKAINRIKVQMPATGKYEIALYKGENKELYEDSFSAFPKLAEYWLEPEMLPNEQYILEIKQNGKLLRTFKFKVDRN